MTDRDISSPRPSLSRRETPDESKPTGENPNMSAGTFRHFDSARPSTAGAVDGVGPASEPVGPIRFITPAAGWYVVVKALVDFMLAIVLTITLLPVVLLAAAIIRLTSRGPAFYVQKRLGLHGKEFHVIKLRTMVHNAEALTGPTWAQPNDSRVTPFGNILRSTHIDEFPQLANILLGQMSLIGPRPERPEFSNRLVETFPHYYNRLAVKPGITGLAQVKLPPDSSEESVRRKLLHDLYYVRHVAPWLDVRILCLTAVQFIASLLTCCWELIRLPNTDEVNLQISNLMRDEADDVVKSLLDCEPPPRSPARSGRSDS